MHDVFNKKIAAVRQRPTPEQARCDRQPPAHRWGGAAAEAAAGDGGGGCCCC